MDGDDGAEGGCERMGDDDSEERVISFSSHLLFCISASFRNNLVQNFLCKEQGKINQWT